MGEGQARRRRPFWQETLILVVVAVALAILIKIFLVQAFYIPSESMEPGLVKNDRILVEKPSYWSGGPERGDVIVFEDPGGWLDPDEAKGPTSLLARGMSHIGLYPTGGHLVKRVIGVAGDVIVCCDDRGRISVNGQPLREGGYIVEQDTCNGPMVESCHWRAGPVPAGHVFVMGDNRHNSRDSSAHLCKAPYLGCRKGEEYVDTDLVVGKVMVLVWPHDHFTWIETPDSFDDVPDPKPAG
ncbi:signal peptidase I [Nocardioides sp. KIGAM211]|uniref:Signal peptidase I n=1 Tax=Nocardioides luti TaxID=2761101 RepID=A0A7X0VAH8_9ACTN|nr:signal peptidase I [Nocardioides luti]MBB6626143.1 signal peptidase I [Nocardioides luti]